jgi:hypothetical protein
MPRRNNRLIFLILGLIVMSVVWSCSQPDDVLTGISSTKITLSEQRLPTLPDSMAYELWVLNTTTDDYVSLGKFLYDKPTGTYHNLDGTERSNEFILNGDIYNFDFVAVTVENNPDPNKELPGSVMLGDVVSDPNEDPIELVFPEKDSLWRATARYNMEGVSDNNRNIGVGSGVWFTSYQMSTKSFPDTTLIVYEVDSALAAVDVECEVDSDGNTLGCDTLNFDELYAPREHAIDSVWYETTLVVYGPDTLLLGAPRNHIGPRVHIDSIVDSTAPWYDYSFSVDQVASTIVPRTDTLDIFAQGDLGVPDYSDEGWHYKGWIVSPYLDTNAIAARMTPPAWPYASLFDVLMTGSYGALITTGSFYRMNQPDLDGNPFAVSDKVPQYPGEDFLNSSALQATYGITSVNLEPLLDGNVGTVFITLEPDNFNSTTNFPLFAFVKSVPWSRSTIAANLVQIDMTNWTSTLDNDLRGFPKIKVSIERY